MFQGLTEAELDVVAASMSRRALSEGELVAREGDTAEDLFVLTEGHAEVLKTDRSGKERRIGTVEPGEIVGEVALFDQLPRAATVRLTTLAEVWTLKFQDLRPAGPRSSFRSDVHASAYHKLVVNIAGGLSAKFRVQADESLAAVQRREVMGSFLVSVLFLMCGYVFFLAGLERLATWIPQNTMYVSVPLQALFGIASWAFIRQTGYPLESFGIGLRGLFSSVFEALLFTIPVLAVVTGLKWLQLRATGTADAPLIEHPDVFSRLAEPLVQRLLIAYAVSSAVQELIARGALQSSLEMFIARPTARRDAIVLTALLFSMMHLHMSFAFALVALVPGLFWGWLFARRKNLVGVTLSHILVGGYVFFILGVRL